MEQVRNYHFDHGQTLMTAEDEGFQAGPNKSTTNIGWLVGSYNGSTSPNSTAAHIGMYINY
jgi:hypothetical protein